MGGNRWVRKVSKAKEKKKKWEGGGEEEKKKIQNK